MKIFFLAVLLSGSLYSMHRVHDVTGTLMCCLACHRAVDDLAVESLRRLRSEASNRATVNSPSSRVSSFLVSLLSCCCLETQEDRSSGLDSEL